MQKHSPLSLIIKGFFIGIANIIPGVSGGTLMITLGIYPDIIAMISHFFADLPKHLRLLLFLGIGAAIAIVGGSFFITAALANFTLPTIIFFIALILGGVPMLFSKVKTEIKNPFNLIIFLLTFMLILIMTFSGGGDQAVSLSQPSLLGYINLFLVGLVAAASMVVPGVSGSFLLILLGYYTPIMETIKSLVTFSNLFHDLTILAAFGLGVLVGIVLVAKLIEYLLQKFTIPTYFAILGFVLSSIIAIFVTALGDGMTFSPGLIAASVPLALGGFFIAYKLGES